MQLFTIQYENNDDTMSHLTVSRDIVLIFVFAARYDTTELDCKL